MFAVVVTALAVLLATLPNRETTCRRRAMIELAGAAIPLPTDVIPLTWNGSVYEATFQVGSDTVSAAFDTGSARFIVATDACTTCTGQAYSPDKSAAALTLYDPRVTGAPAPCSADVTYGSQTDVVQMYRDTVTFPRKTLASTVVCTGGSVDAAVAAAPNAAALTITDFPVGGITSNTGTSSLNVLGMSGVLSVTKITENGTSMYLLPSCETSPVAVFESATLQAVSMYCQSQGISTVWSMMVGDTTGFVLFAPLHSAACPNVQYVPMVESLVNASSSLVSTPWRYYVVSVIGLDIDGRAQPIPPNFQVFLDTGTTQFEIPGPNAASIAGALNSMQPGQTATLLLTNGAKVTLTSAVASYMDANGNTQPTFAAMPDDYASAFSSQLNVGIFGASAMRGLYLEFDLSTRRVGFS